MSLKQKRKGLDRSDITSISALLISLVALCIGIIETNIMGRQQEIMKQQQNIMAEQQKNAVWPFVETKTSLSFDEEIVIQCTIENKGIGPAIINQLALSFDGKIYKSAFEFKKIIETKFKDKLPSYSFYISEKVKTVVKPNEVQEIFTLKIPSSQSTIQDVIRWNAQLNLCYCSVNNDCWREKGIAISDEMQCP